MIRFVLLLFLTTIPLSLMAEDSVVIFIPGLYGCFLKEAATNKTRWLSLSEILFGNRTLKVCDLDQRPCEHLVAGEIVKEVSIVPFLYSEDVYGETLASLKEKLPSNVEIAEFAYDWRLDITSHTKSLDRLIDNYKQQHKRVFLVAHSMGGLLAGYYLRYGTQPPETAQESWDGARKIDKLVLAAVPFGGSAMAFIDLVMGRRVGINTSLLSTESYQSFASTYQLLPAESNILLDKDFNPLAGSLLKLSTWYRYRLANLDSSPGENHFISTGIQKSKRFKDLLFRPVSKVAGVRVPTLSVRGKNKRTLEKVVMISPERFVHDEETWEKYFDSSSDDTLYVDGDSVVSWSASDIPQSLKTALSVREISSDRNHRLILKQDDVLDAIGELFMH